MTALAFVVIIVVVDAYHKYLKYLINAYSWLAKMKHWFDFTFNLKEWRCLKKTWSASLWSLSRAMERRQNMQSKHMRYDMIKFKSNVDIAMLCFLIFRCIIPTPSWCVFLFVCLFVLLFTKAILELQSEKYLKIIEEDEVLQMEQKDKSLFVFSSFTSPAFMHCQKVWYLDSCEIQH